MRKLIIDCSERDFVKKFSLAVSMLLLFVCVSLLASDVSVQQKSVSAAQQTQVNKIDFVELIKVNSNIRLDIKYATDDNFTKKCVYTQAKCYLRQEVAQKLNGVQQELEQQGLGLKVFDGYRPRSVQYKFWELVPIPGYVADPNKGSKHNRGSAVDLTIIRLSDNQELEMPSEFDEFSEKAHREYEAMKPEAAKNCKLLEDLMVKHGFIPLPTEWWHFDDADWEKYELLDISFEDVQKQLDAQDCSEQVVS